MKRKSLLIRAGGVGFAVLTLSTLLLAIALAADPLGDVEKQPGEVGAESIFNKFGGNPWRGGEPWAWSSQGAADSFTSSVETSKSLNVAPAHGFLGNDTMQMLGTISPKDLVLLDFCVLNRTCNQSMALSAPGGTYNVYKVFRGEEYIGLWLENVSSA